MSFLVGFWLGLAIGLGGYWLVTHPTERAELIAKAKALIRRQ